MTGPERRPSVRAQMVRYFEDNPDEELTIADAAVKFRVSRRSIISRLYELRQIGLVETVTVIRRAKGLESRS